MTAAELSLPVAFLPEAQPAESRTVATPTNLLEGASLLAPSAPPAFPVIDKALIQADIERRHLQALVRSMLKLETHHAQSVDPALRARLKVHMAETMGNAWELLRPMLLAASGLTPEQATLAP